ncbi:CheR family methyltransferase [Sulfurimonas sp.]|uniref:CheR family methyltransferase n=1 Tax=Sulfurimonas sp. TaxID=2022749 RepID=UPI002B478BC1|nr:CheR family methyltransferase [Sulfurimonas sp.]
MIKLFNNKENCHVVLEAPLTSSDTKQLSLVFSKNYFSWHLEFTYIYAVDIEILNILYREIFENLKKITITTHQYKLNKYFYKLGFKTTFESLIKLDVVNLENIEVILIGGSTDSSSKILEIVKNVKLDNSTLVVVQHTKPNKLDFFDEILNKHTKYKVSYAKDGEKIKKASIYLAPNNKHLKVIDGHFSLCDSEKYNFAKPSVSLSYESFSSYYKDKLLVIQECGFASDGVDKLRYLKSNNSVLIIQKVEECKAKSMVKNALAVNAHDYVFSIKDIVIYINIVDNITTKEAWVEYLVDMIEKKYDYNFKLYHVDMISRRLSVFMTKNSLRNIKDAISMIIFNKSAFKAFFLDISINVTEFFRNTNSFKQVAEILQVYAKGHHSLKVWSAGCSSGEEAFSVAILLDYLKLLDKTIIYATDFNDVVLQEAKNALYSKESYYLALSNLAKFNIEIILNNYLVQNNNFVSVNNKIKEKIHFFQHNLVEDSSFNEFDMIVCKNVIIYFEQKLQNRVFALFYESLKFGGYLILGESESIIQKYADKFEVCAVCEVNNKIFRKVA